MRDGPFWIAAPDPDEPAAVTTLVGVGLTEPFAQAGTGSGFTCCQTADLDNADSTATQRIDCVFVDAGTAPSVSTVDSSQVVLNSRVAKSTGQGQVWPSDHFGVLTLLNFE